MRPAGAAAEHVGGEAGLQAGQGEGGTGLGVSPAGPPARGRSQRPAALSPFQPPIQVYGLEGRYATALYSAASKQKKLDQVEKELSRVWVRRSPARLCRSWRGGLGAAGLLLGREAGPAPAHCGPAARSWPRGPALCAAPRP